jgi:SAM-dependent methyltransferase
MTQIIDVYGKYSLGSGAVLTNADKVWSALADPDVLASYESSMRRDLTKSGIAIEKLRDWHVMDVGTGRQALAFLNMGARRVSHFDISAENVEGVSAYINEAQIGGRLNTRCCDLVTTDLGREQYNFVYLNGIVQHFSDVGRGLENCIRALKQGGYLWLYFYRSGTFDNFVLYLLRDLAYGSNIASDPNVLREYFLASLMAYSEDARKNYLSSIFMDGVFTRYAHLYTPATYLRFAEAGGLEVVSSSGLDPVGRDVDHYFARAATVVTFRKTRSNADLSSALGILAPESEVDQLDPSHYDDPGILRTIERYRKVRSRLRTPSVPSSVTIAVVLRIFHFLASKSRANGYDVMHRHTDLQTMLENIDRLLADEYPESGLAHAQ